jgi:two-component system OmpR family sensor kinase
MTPPAPWKRASLRTQLVVALLGLLAVALVGTGVVTALTLRSYLSDRTDAELVQAAQPLQRALRSGRLPPRRPGEPALPSDYVLALVGPDGQVLETFGAAVDVADLPRLPLPEVRARAGEPFGVGAGLRAVVYPLGRRGSLLVATPTIEAAATFRRLLLAELAVGAVALSGLGLLGWLAVTRSLRPLARIEDTAEAIAAGDLSRRVPEPASPTTEVGRLSRALNGMLSQIERAFRSREESQARMRRFVADASHELRTPLTSIRGFAELYRQGAVRGDAEVAAAMRRIEGEAARMGGLVDDLLLLARLDEQRPLARDPVDVRQIARDAVADARAVAPERSVAIEDLGGGERLVVLGDDARLRQVVGNLLSNALAHTPPDSPVVVRVGAAGDAAPVVVEVADRGPGLSADQAAHVFDRFFRVDRARTRAAGGAGLGLSIVAAITAAHGGRADVQSAVGEGATFRVELPRRPPEPSTQDSQEPLSRRAAQYQPGGGR